MGHKRRSLRLSVMLTAVLVFVSAFVHVRTSAQSRAKAESRTSPQKSAPCPLTDAQTSKSIDAFAKIANSLTREPRCVNCHGGVNPHIKDTGLDPGDEAAPASKVVHGGGPIRRQNEPLPTGGFFIEGECRDCHNSMARKTNGSESLWMTAPNFLSFVDKDATTLCRQIKRAGGTAEHFLGHLRDDNGGNAFGKTAFNGDRGLDKDRYEIIRPEPPSISHAALMQLGQDWVTAMGGSFKGDESCGCEFKHKQWSGQVRYTFDSNGDEAHDAQVDWSGRNFSQMVFTFKDGVGTVTGYAEVKNHREFRRGIVNNGSASLIKESSDDTQGSGSRTIPATVDVMFRENGEYEIQPASSLQPLGTSRTVSCRYARDGAATCRTQDLPLYLEQWTAGDLSGNSSDPNHVEGSKTDKREGVGSSRKGVIIRTLTWDLWRSN